MAPARQYHAPRSNLRDPDVRQHFVYTLIGADGEVLYVGRTVAIRRRLREHSSSNSEWFGLVAHVRMKGPYGYDFACQLEHQLQAELRPVWGQTRARWATQYAEYRAHRKAVAA